MSLRLKLVLLMLAGMFLLLLLVLYAENRQEILHGEIEEIRQLSDEFIKQAESIDVSFQKQLLAWSNLLLRGIEPEEYYRYLQAFYKQERETHKKIIQLKKDLGIYPGMKNLMLGFINVHKALGVRSREALKIYNQSDNPIYDADQYLLNFADEPVRLLSDIKNEILVNKWKKMEEEEVRYDDYENRIVILATTFVVAFLIIFIWLIDISFGKPLSKVIELAENISAGDLGRRAPEDLPGEFGIFAKVFNQMLKRLSQANIDLQNTMREMKNEISRREQVEYELEQEKLVAVKASISKSEFLSTTSHEIRTPLNVITGYAEMLSKTNDREKQKKYISSIQSGSESLLNIINDVLDFAKIEAGKLNIEKTKFDLYELIDEVSCMFSKMAKDKGLIFNTTISDNVSQYIVMDGNRVKQILINLLSNAIKFTADGIVNLSVNVSSIRDSSHVDLCISVEDNGIGIPEEYHELIFNQFEQQDGQDSRRYGGTGLGLAISAKLSDMLGGSLDVTSVPDKGSVFTLTLNNVEIEDEVCEENDENNQFVLQLRNCKILIADDIEDNRILLKNFLEGQPIEFFEVKNGKLAIEAAHTFKPDLILMDIQMPEMDGVEATKIIKADDDLRHIPIIALTASSIKGEDAQEKESLFDDYLAKPINLSVLTTSLNRFLASNQVV